MKKMVVDGSQPSLGQVRDLVRQCADGTLGKSKVQAILEGRVIYPWEINIGAAVAGNILLDAISIAEIQASLLFGYNVNIAKMFALPETVPWKETLAVLIPPGMDNRKVVNSLEKYKLVKREKVDVNYYSGSEASDKPKLFLVERSLHLTRNTMGKSPNALVKTSRIWLPLRGYALAFGQFFSATGGYLDVETWPWFPSERLPGDEVACAGWNPDYCCVGFSWNNAALTSNFMGAREAIEVPLKTQALAT